MPIKILLVEDNPADADFLQELLEASAGVEWKVVPVELRREAQEQLRNDCFDIVLLDLSLPDSHGLETLTRLREVAPDTPMVVMTGFNDEAAALDAVRMGAQDYLVKGQITTQLLVRAIRYAIERSQTLQLLQESERRFHAIFDQTFQFTGLLAPDGTVLEMNQTALKFAGVREEEVMGRPFWETPSWDLSPAREQLQKALLAAAKGEFVRYEVELRGAGDTVAVVDFSLKPVFDETGKVRLLIAEGRDISERKQAESKIMEALEKEKELSSLRSRFVSMVSHEFRTPLSTILLSAGLLESYSSKWPEEKKQIHFHRIQAAVKRMTELLEDILLIGKVEAGQLEFNPAPLDLEKFCHEVVEELRLTDANQHSLTFSCQGSSNRAKMDKKLLRHILSNLLSNAMKYSPVGSPIRLELTCPPAGAEWEKGRNTTPQIPEQNCQMPVAVFRIQDGGIGIPPEDLNRIFDTFQRATNAGTISGTGLGLAIVKRSVELHGGQISVESEVGAGTTFTVLLPLHEPSSLL